MKMFWHIQDPFILLPEVRFVPDNIDSPRLDPLIIGQTLYSILYSQTKTLSDARWEEKSQIFIFADLIKLILYNFLWDISVIDK